MIAPLVVVLLALHYCNRDDNVPRWVVINNRHTQKCRNICFSAAQNSKLTMVSVGPGKKKPVQLWQYILYYYSLFLYDNMGGIQSDDAFCFGGTRLN
jgi:hypothetical protein